VETIKIKVEGMTCGGCVRSIENALSSRPGVSDASADLDSGIVTIGYDPQSIQQTGIEAAIEDAGFDVSA
jgi:copper chaperone